MSEVFLSYKRGADDHRAAVVRSALEQLGVKVFIDQSMAPGTDFQRVIKKQIDQAKAVLVLWTTGSLESRFVQGEALHGLKRDILVAATFDGIDPDSLMSPFNTVNTAELSGWLADESSAPPLIHFGWLHVLKGIAEKVGRPALPDLARAIGSGTEAAVAQFAAAHPEDPVALTLAPKIEAIRRSREAFEERLESEQEKFDRRAKETAAETSKRVQSRRKDFEASAQQFLHSESRFSPPSVDDIFLDKVSHWKKQADANKAASEEYRNHAETAERDARNLGVENVALKAAMAQRGREPGQGDAFLRFLQLLQERHLPSSLRFGKVSFRTVGAAVTVIALLVGTSIGAAGIIPGIGVADVLRTELARLDTVKRELETTVAQTVAYMKSLAEERTALRTDLEQATAEKAAFIAKLGDTEAQLAQYREQVGALTGARTELASTVARLTEESLSLRASLERGSKEKSAIEADRVRLINQQAGLQQAVKELDGRLSRAEAASKEAAALRSKLEADQKALSAAQAKMTASQQVLDAKEATLQAEVSRLEKVQTELAAEEKKLAQQREQLERDQQALKGRDQTSRIEEKRLAETRKRLDEAQEAVKKAQERASADEASARRQGESLAGEKQRQADIQKSFDASAKKLAAEQKELLAREEKLRNKELVAQCDAMTAYQHDRDRPGTASWKESHTDIDVNTSGKACLQAHILASDKQTERRIKLQLGRIWAASAHQNAVLGNFDRAENEFKKAVELWEQAAKMDSAHAYNVLGNYYQGLFSVAKTPRGQFDVPAKKDLARAWKYYMDAAQLDNPIALATVGYGLMFPDWSDDWKTLRQRNAADEKKGREYLERASKWDYARTNYFMAYAIREGRGGYPKEPEAAEALFAIAYCKGDAAAANFYARNSSIARPACQR